MARQKSAGKRTIDAVEVPASARAGQPPPSPALRQRMERLYKSIGERARPGLSLEEWVDEFGRESDRAAKVKVWERIEAAFERLGARRWVYTRQRRVIAALLLISMGARDVEGQMKMPRERIKSLRQAYEDVGK